MPRRPGKMPNEKAKDFKGAMKRLLANMKKWRILMVIAIILATASSIFSLISPNKLSDITDAITKGIKPDAEKMTQIIGAITINSAHSDIEIDGVTISIEDQLETMKLLATIDNNDANSMLKAFDKLPSSIYELVKPKMDMGYIKDIALFLLIMYIISAIFGYIQHYMLSTVSNRFAQNLRSRISKKINKLPLRYFDNHETGDILSRVTNDIDTIGHHLNNSLGSLVSAITLFFGCIVMMFYTNWIMAITAILSSLIGFGLMFAILRKITKIFQSKTS